MLAMQAADYPYDLLRYVIAHTVVSNSTGNLNWIKQMLLQDDAALNVALNGLACT